MIVQKKGVTEMKIPKEIAPKKNIPEEDILEEKAVEVELEEEIEEIDKEIEQKNTEEMDSEENKSEEEEFEGEKIEDEVKEDDKNDSEEKVEKENSDEEKPQENQENKEPKKTLRNLFSDKTTIYITGAILALLASALIFAFLFSDKMFRKNQKATQETTLKVIEPTKQNQESIKLASEEGQKEEFIKSEEIDSSGWPTYTSKYYGFGLKYPPEWNKVAVKYPIRGSKWIQRYQFRKKTQEENNPYLGFNVTVYDIKKTKELKNTEEFPTVKEGVDPNGSSCQTIEDHLEENPNHPNEEIYFPIDDDCYNTALFYSLTRKEYIFTVIPVYVEGSEKPEYLRKQTLEKFPEFIEAATSFSLIDIARPKPKPAAPKITAPKPVAAKNVGGRLVCAKKTDHPGKSKQNKGKHLDMECCLDPDEYPNPWCYYDPKKYGKYLK